MSTHLQKQLKQSLIWRGLYFILSFITTVCISRILKADASGDFSYLLTVLSLIVLVVGFNLDSAFTYYLSANVISAKKIIFISLSVIILISILINILFKSSYYDEQLIVTNNLKINVYQCSIYYFIGIMFLSVSTSILYGLQDFKTSNYVLIILNSFFLGLIAFRYTSNSNNFIIVEDFCFLTLVTGILLFLIVVLKTGVLKGIELPSLRDYKSVYRYASIIMLSNLIFFFVYKLDYNFVKNWCNGSKDLGNYLQASKFAQILLVVPQIIASTIFPQISNKDQKSDVVIIIGRLVRLFSILFLFLFAAFLIIGKWFFPFLFGESFNTMYLPTVILIPGIYCLAISSLYSAYFSGTKQNKVNLIGAVVAIIVMVSLSFICQSFYTIKIAALISLLAYFSESFYVAFQFYKREGGFKVFDLISFRKEDWTWLMNTLNK